MGHSLELFIQDLLSTSASSGFEREQVLLVVDNARMTTSEPMNLAPCSRFLPDENAPQQRFPRASVIDRFSREPDLDVSDHARGESRWGSISRVDSGSSVPVTPSRKHPAGAFQCERETDFSSPRSVLRKQLSPVIEENGMTNRSPGFKHDKVFADCSSLLDVQNLSALGTTQRHKADVKPWTPRVYERLRKNIDKHLITPATIASRKSSRFSSAKGSQ